jgi:hypothetical protein
VEPLVVVPVDPFQGGELDVGERLPGAVALIFSALKRPIVLSARALS